MSFCSFLQFFPKGIRAVLDTLFPPGPIERRVRDMTASDLVSYLNHPVEIRVHSKILNSAVHEQTKNTLSLFNYRDETIKHMIWLLKYKKNRHVADLFATILHDRLAEDVGENALFGVSSRPLLVPVPISKKRRKERGYNQTELLAKALVERAGTSWYDYVPDILLKIKETPPQTSCANKAERARNLRGAFRVNTRATGASVLKDRTVIILDDITTTGATFTEARSALRNSGAKNIIAVALAH